MSYGDRAPISGRMLVLGRVGAGFGALVTLAFGVLSVANLLFCWNLCSGSVQATTLVMAALTLLVAPAYLIWLVIGLARRRVTMAHLALASLIVVAFVMTVVVAVAMG